MSRNSNSKKSFPWGAVFTASVFIFAAWVYFYEYKGEEERQTEKSKASALLPFSNSDVREIRLRAKPGGEPQAGFVETALVKDSSVSGEVSPAGSSANSVWKVESPYKDLADGAVVESFLSALSTETTQETVLSGTTPTSIQWTTYGLDQPSAEVTMKALKNGTEVERRIAIGSVPAFDGSVYVRIDGANQVATVSANVIATLQKDPCEFRDKRFFSATKFPEFSALQVLRPGLPKIDIILKDGVWMERAARAGTWPLDQGIVKAYVDSVVNLRGSEVWAEDKSSKAVLKSRKLDQPGLEVIILANPSVTEATKDKSPPSYRIKLAALSGEQTVAAGFGSEKPLVFSVYKAQIENLTKTIDDFRDLKFPFQFKLDQIQAIEFERAQGGVSLPNVVRREKTWILDPADTRFQGRTVKPEAIDAVLSGISSLQVRRLVPLSASAKPSVPKLSDRGTVRVGMFDVKNRPLIEFLFHANDETVRATSSLAPGRVFELDKAAFEKVSFDVLTPPPPSASEKEKK